MDVDEGIPAILDSVRPQGSSGVGVGMVLTDDDVAFADEPVAEIGVAVLGGHELKIERYGLERRVSSSNIHHMGAAWRGSVVDENQGVAVLEADIARHQGDVETQGAEYGQGTQRVIIAETAKLREQVLLDLCERWEMTVGVGHRYSPDGLEWNVMEPCHCQVVQESYPILVNVVFRSLHTKNISQEDERLIGSHGHFV